jgi:hypothetical protein
MGTNGSLSERCFFNSEHVHDITKFPPLPNGATKAAAAKQDGPRDGPVAPLRKAYQCKGLANRRWAKIHWQVNNPGHQR